MGRGLRSAIFRNFAIFPQLPFACPPCVPVGVLCGTLQRCCSLRFGYGTAIFPPFSRKSPQFPRNFSELDLTLPGRNPLPPPLDGAVRSMAHHSGRRWQNRWGFSAISLPSHSVPIALSE